MTVVAIIVLVGVGVFRGAIIGQGAGSASRQNLQGIGQMFVADGVIVAGHAQFVGLEQHLGMGHAGRGIEFVAGQFEELP